MDGYDRNPVQEKPMTPIRSTSSVTNAIFVVMSRNFAPPDILCISSICERWWGERGPESVILNR